jgi:hypothetical protein
MVGLKNWKGCEGNGRDLILILFRHLHGRTEENDESSARINGASAEIQKDNLRNTSVERYRYANLLGLR